MSSSSREDAIDNMHHAELYGRVPLGCGDGERESIGALRIGACIGAVRGCGVAACVGMTYEASLRAEMRIDETYMAPSEMRHSCPYRPDVNMTKQ